MREVSFGDEHGIDSMGCQKCSQTTRPCGGNAISNNRGPLLANKQIHAEVSKVLFSQDHFAMVIDAAEPQRTVWNCGLPSC